jgi:hypothetical protein
LLLLWIALAETFRENGRPSSGGLALAMCAAKFHLLPPFPLFFTRVAAVGQRDHPGGIVLCRRRWDWPGRYLRAFGPAIHPNPRIMPNLHGLLPINSTWLDMLVYVLSGIGNARSSSVDSHLAGVAAALVSSLLLS